MKIFVVLSIFVICGLHKTAAFSQVKKTSTTPSKSFISNRFHASSTHVRKNRSVLLETRAGGDNENDVDFIESFAEEPAAVALTSKERNFLQTLLIVEMAIVKKQIAANWGFILLGGTASLLAGAYLISLPLLGTEVALLTTICTLLGVGFSNLMSGFYAEQGYKLPGILVGGTQLLLGVLYATEPVWMTAAAMTLGLCAVITTDGLYRCILAMRNRSVDGYWATFWGGFASVAGSAWAMSHLGISSLVLPGLALGLSLVSGGLSRIVISLHGRNYAIRAMEGATAV